MFNYEWIYHIEKEKKMLSKRMQSTSITQININNAIKKLGLQYPYDTDKLMRTIEGNLKIQ
jgi:hypothetical protein